MKVHKFVGVLAVAVAINSIARAQNSGAPGDFTIERVLGISSIIAPTAPNLPPPVLAGLQNGTLEVHQVFVYNSAQRTLEQTAFVVPGKSPLPFPSPGNAPLADHYIIRVDSASLTSQPGPSAVLTGKVISNDAPTPWGDITGAVVTLSFGYQGSGAATRLGPIYESVSPLYGLYTAMGVGSLSLTPSPSSQGCSAATLNGVYTFQLRGSIQNGTGGQYTPYVDSGRFVADGQGKITIIDAVNANGTVFTDRNFPATYVLDQYCSGTLQLPGSSMNIVVSKDGQRVNLIFASPSSIVAMGTGQLQ